MPRISSIYSIPPGTEGFPDTTIESEKYNNYIHDVEADLNAPRPISAGGTGANNADAAIANLGGEKSSQAVSNYSSHVFFPGSFYSVAGATDAPNGHAFVGIAVSSDPPKPVPDNKNVVIRAYDQSGTTVPGRIYVREKKPTVAVPNGLWGPWSIDGTGVVGPTPPADPPDGLLWFDSESGHLYVYYNDGNSKQWVIASPFSDPAQFLLKAGDTMTGALTLSGPPTADLHATTRKFVQDVADAGTALIDGKVSKAGDTMTGSLTVPAMTVTGAISAGGRVTTTSETNGFFANNNPSAYFGFAGDGTTRRFYFNTQAYWFYNTATADMQWIANPNVACTFRYSDNSFIISGQGFKPGGGAWVDSSDARIKTVEADYTRGLAEVAQLRPVLYTYKGNDTSGPDTTSLHKTVADSKKKFTGLVAQEVEVVIPEMVTQSSAHIDGVAVTDLRNLDTTPLIFALVNCVKELKARIEALES